VRLLVFLSLLSLLFPLSGAHAAAEGKKMSSTPNRYGALAQHRPSGSWGAGHGFARQVDASREALKQCGQPRCEVVHKFKNGCAVLVDGKAKSFAASGVTRDEAETRALKRCGGEKCTVIAWACTRP
jgi:Domain of unknown function (DUF4189)